MTRRTPNRLISNCCRKSVQAYFFDNGHVSNAGVVDQDIDAAAFFQHEFDSQFAPRHYRRHPSPAKCEWEGALRAQAVEFFALGGGPAGGKDKITATGKEQCCSLAEAIRATGDEYSAFRF